MYTMLHPYRGEITNKGRKSIQVSDFALDPGNHFSFGCILQGDCKQYHVSPEDGYFLHYRINWTVNDQCKDGKCVEYDPIVFKYKSRLELNMKNVLAHILQ